MHSLIKIVVFLLAGQLFADTVRKVSEGDQLPPDGFKSYAEFSVCSRSSSFGGGVSGELVFIDKKIFFLIECSRQVFRHLNSHSIH